MIMSSNSPLVPTIEDTVKEVIGNLKTYKQEASQTKNKNPIRNESDKDMSLNKLSSLDKSGYVSRTETEDTVKPQNKTGSVSSASLDDKDTKEQQPKEVMIRNNKLISDNQSVSIMSVHGASITTVSPEKYCIPRKIKKKPSEILITRNEITQKPDNPSKNEKVDSSIDGKNLI